MDISTVLEKIPHALVPVVIYFPFAIGVFAIASFFIRYTRLLLDLFVLPGTNVRPPPLLPLTLLIICSSENMARKEPGQ